MKKFHEQKTFAFWSRDFVCSTENKDCWPLLSEQSNKCYFTIMHMIQRQLSHTRRDKLINSDESNKNVMMTNSPDRCV